MNSLHSNLSFAASLVKLALVSVSLANGQVAQNAADTISSISATQIIIKTGGQPRTYRIDPKTLITLNGQPAKAEDLMAGDAVKVVAAPSDDSAATARSIDATRKSKKPDDLGPANPAEVAVHDGCRPDFAEGVYREPTSLKQ